MKRSDLLLLLVYVGSIALLISASLPSGAASFSGKVVDETGAPVSGITVALLPQLSETDETGAFSITDIAADSVSTLMLLPVQRNEYEIRTIEIEGVTFYLDPLNVSRPPWQEGGFSIAIAPDADIKAVEITVRFRMRIRGRVLLTDGTPLREAEIQFEIDQRSRDGRRRGSKGYPRNLDGDGYFFEYVEEPGFYTVAVAYQGQFAESMALLLEEGQRA